MPVALPPPSPPPERILCSVEAAVKFDIPANVLLAVAEKEGGRPGLRVRNANGTEDIGQLQFNSAYLGTLAPLGIREADVAAAGCYPYELAAWRIRQHIRHDGGDFWTRVANYHSRTPAYNVVYRADLMVKAARWADWLSARLATYEQADPQARSAREPGAVTAPARVVVAGR